MKGEMHYRESWPKELRLTIENEDELRFLKLIFSDSPETHLRRYKVSDLEAVGLSKSWRDNFIKKCNNSDDLAGPYETYYVYEAIEQEQENMELLKQAEIGSENF